MAYRPSFKKGDWKAECDRCGFIYKASELIQTWDGLLVCRYDFEGRHPQEFVRGVPDKQTPPWIRPEDINTNIGNVTIGLINPMTGATEGTESTNSVRTYGIGSMIIGFDVNPFEVD